jgi:uncharacterized membrane protein YfcA
VDILYLSVLAFCAGFVDSVVGGGGLIQLPALFLLLPAELVSVPATVLGTNKLSSICGTCDSVGTCSSGRSTGGRTGASEGADRGSTAPGTA